MRRSFPALLLLVLLTATLVAPVVASPQPRPVCGPCGGGLERAARGEPVGPLNVEASTAIVRVHPDGSASWRVTTRLGNGSAAAYLSEHRSVLEAIVRDSLRYSAVRTDFRDVEASIDGRTVRATFSDPAAAKRMSGGVLVTEYLHSRGYDARTVLTADRLTVVGPPGTVVTNEPAGAEVEGRNATWRGSASARLSGAPRLEHDAYVAFGGDDTASSLWTRVDLARRTAPIVWDVASTFFLPPVLLLGVLLAAAVTAARQGDLGSPGSGVDRASLAVAGLGVLLVVGPLLLDLPVVLGGSPVLPGAGVVYIAMGAAARWRERSVRGPLVAGALAAVIAVASLALLAPGDGGHLPSTGLGTVAGLLPLPLAVVVGAASRRGNWRRLALALAATVGAVLGFMLSIVSPTQRPFGLVVVVFLGYALLVGVGMIPGVVLGARVGIADRGDAEGVPTGE